MKALVSLIACLLCVSPAQADEQRRFRLSGFGTAAGTYASTDEADYRVNVMQPTGTGRAGRFDAGTDSKLGVQLDLFLDPRFTATVQALSQRNVDGNFKPDVEWANLKYLATDAAYVRAGRIAAPVYMISDHRNVGYSLTWVRPSTDVYANVSLFNMDGVDAGYRLDLGKATLDLQAVGGRFDTTIDGNGLRLDVKGHGALYNALLEYGDTTVRLGYSDLRVSLETPESGLFDQFDAALAPLVAFNAPGAAAVDSRFYSDDIHTRLYGIGINHDSSTWVAQSELIYRKSSSAAIPDVRAWYVFLAYRLGRFTPFAGYGENKSIGDAVPVVDASGFPAELQGAAAGVNAVTASFQVPSDQETVSLGLRYDLRKNMALKLQLDRIAKPAGSSGLFNNTQAGFVNERQTVYIGALALDFIF